MGYLCSYVPEEMIHAAGFTPVRLRGTSRPLQYADAHLQSFSCALCRSALDRAVSGELNTALAGVVLAHTCDAMQALGDLWRMHSPESHFLDTVMQPANLGTPAARDYLVAELAHFGRKLSAFAGRPLSDGDIQASIALYDETRRLVASLQDSRGRLSAAAFYAILDAAQAMPREEFNPRLANLLTSLGESPVPPAGPRLFLAGAILDEPRLIELVDELGAEVAGDDLCSGLRHFWGTVGSDKTPLDALAGYYLRRPPCPTKLHPAHDPGRHLVDQARRAGASGVVFVLEKFCEPHAFEHALSLPALERAGLPYLVLEMEQVPSIEALRTRLQAFLEIL
jgi:benzoyl-CoA reductase/2-hydroxyglutaryl-CoA dehydratase subunit BcrC/BadD/HgdB